MSNLSHQEKYQFLSKAFEDNGQQTLDHIRKMNKESMRELISTEQVLEAQSDEWKQEMKRSEAETNKLVELNSELFKSKTVLTFASDKKRSSFESAYQVEFQKMTKNLKPTLIKF